MKLTFLLEEYLYKYYVKRFDVETSLIRKSIPGMLALGQSKNYMPIRNVDIEKLTCEVYFTVSFKKLLRLRINSPSENALKGFNANIRGLFYDEYFEFMDERSTYMSDEQLIVISRDFMDKYSLSEDDVNVQTLLRNYRRYRNKQCEAKQAS
ncbi:MAG: hypothetical protein NXI00_11050 [Cytophagales bacterium]|nr:hypothetical protein [Cytophagales bacterium]